MFEGKSAKALANIVENKLMMKKNIAVSVFENPPK
jgi:hypothetical protein